MRTLKNILTIATVFVIAFSLSVKAQQPRAPKMPAPKTDAKGKVFMSVDHIPEFPGGIGEFGKFVSKRIKYPDVDKNVGTQGKVYVSFIVEKDGKLTDVVAVRGPSETMKAEAIKVVKNSPAWKPGIQAGKPVRTQFTVPIEFTLGS